jgi:hypothetical protein
MERGTGGRCPPMTLLASPAFFAVRRTAASGPLAPLADALAAELEPLLVGELFMPTEKAKLTRVGGRCSRDGSLLAFDPFDRTSHRCEQCGETYHGEAHYRAWLLWYQLWLAERAVHGALLFVLRRDDRHAELSERILAGYAERYLSYPNQDNVLGPTRPFFSTYLESIWTLQLCMAIDLLESGGRGGESTDAARERILGPSADLIASYDEGFSNRQVWNNAALLATGLLLGRRHQVEDALLGRSGLVALLDHALLADGSWYEGENYHLFAHRGLWYGVTIGEAAGLPVPGPLVERFQSGFALPFITALPDFTFPSRRDSQYGVSLRQWRFAELCELGLARRPGDERLRTALEELYSPAHPAGDTGRSRSAAEVERNLPPVRLDRSDLGWRSLLYALPQLPPLRSPQPPASVLLDGQGLVILRRDAGRVYLALDYGHSGGGHGHPDRLNLLLVDGATRWLDDMGTGSYVDPSLHWYRSTLAHNAPLIDGKSQASVDGELRAYEERGAAGWVEAAATIAPGVDVSRTLVVLADYAIERLSWRAPHDVQLDLPIHADGELKGIGTWAEGWLSGGNGLEDGFSFVRRAERGASRPRETKRLLAQEGDARAEAWILPATPAEWWRLSAPGAPGRGDARFHLARLRGGSGAITTVWSWRGAVTSAALNGEEVRVVLSDGTEHTHSRTAAGWRVAVDGAGARSLIELGGLVPPRPRPSTSPASAPPTTIPLHRSPPGRGWWSEANAFTRGNLFVVDLSEGQYRRSEQSWLEAGAPEATVLAGVRGSELVVEVFVRKRDVRFAPPDLVNELDNEHPDVNSDGIQLYVQLPAVGGAPLPAPAGWLIVPEHPAPRARATVLAGMNGSVPLAVEWKDASDGYAIHAAIALPGLERSAAFEIGFDVIVNEISPGRERRRGQLVLSGGGGEFVYLRGDRQAASKFLRFRVEK